LANTIVTQRDTQLEKQRVGLFALTITNLTNDDEPAIASGSVVEISGTLYSFTSNEAITGWSGMSNGSVWIKLVPDGTNPCTAEFTDTAPTWSDGKQGWYDGTGTDRYVAGLQKTGASGYEEKFLMNNIHRGVIPFSRVETLDSAASGNWIVPAGVYVVHATVIGGGGGGGGSGSSASAGGAGGSSSFNTTLIADGGYGGPSATDTTPQAGSTPGGGGSGAQPPIEFVNGADGGSGDMAQGTFFVEPGDSIPWTRGSGGSAGTGDQSNGGPGAVGAVILRY
jgi:hypothetical protein